MVLSWLLKEYVEVRSAPVTSILNSCFAEQKCPPSWKMADIVPFPKLKPVTDINNHHRLISLTPTIPKIAEDLRPTGQHVGQERAAVLKVVDPHQFRGIPRSSTLHALSSMLHHWLQTTEGTAAAVTITLFDYKRAFELRNHNILVCKVLSLFIPRNV